MQRREDFFAMRTGLFCVKVKDVAVLTFHADHNSSRSGAVKVGPVARKWVHVLHSVPHLSKTSLPMRPCVIMWRVTLELETEA